MLPERRRAEGIGYWGLSTRGGDRRGADVGFWIYQSRLGLALHRRRGLNLIMAAIAWNLRRQRADGESWRIAQRRRVAGLLEWRVLIVSVTLFLYSFGYGGITSFTALYADANGVTPKSIYLTTLAIVILLTRPLAGRLGDRFGYRRVFVPCLVLIMRRAWAAWRSAARGLADRVGGRLRRRLRHRLSGLRRLRDAGSGRRPARRRVWRDPRGVRHRHRHRLDRRWAG